MSMKKLVFAILIFAVSLFAWGKNSKYKTDPYVTELGFSIDQAAYFDSLGFSYVDASTLVENANIKTYDEMRKWYLTWKMAIKYNSNIDLSELNGLIVKDIVVWKNAGFNLDEAIEWKKVSQGTVYVNYAPGDYFKCKQNGLMANDIAEFSNKIVSKFGIPKEQIVTHGWVVSLVLLPDLFKIFTKDEILLLYSNKEIRREITSQSLQFGVNKLRLAIQWKKRGLSVDEIVNYMVLVKDVEQALLLKKQGIDPLNSQSISYALSETIFKVYSTPDYNLNKPHEYSFKVRPFVLFVKDSSALERFIIQGLKDNNDVTLMTESISQTKYEIFNDNAKQEVYVIGEKNIECPWGKRKIIKVEFIDSKEVFWTPEIGVK